MRLLKRVLTIGAAAFLIVVAAVLCWPARCAIDLRVAGVDVETGIYDEYGSELAMWYVTAKDEGSLPFVLVTGGIDAETQLGDRWVPLPKPVPLSVKSNTDKATWGVFAPRESKALRLHITYYLPGNWQSLQMARFIQNHFPRAFHIPVLGTAQRRHYNVIPLDHSNPRHREMHSKALMLSNVVANGAHGE